ncbi:erythromycin esterase family protein [Hymenobacter busanensis]|uniref:Erythromycin esterase family protein n=1 Tax=Hymenobacter busanensis TaxID=2607656 RepID=A0A7L4ZZ83_9BACT|nr:erythromycin esterase family protein [Hymenobacter busanensis]KAA9333072.1 erythromycin esterase family protein [Hymenobacter busanensis]QHJ08253.1 erythromycin esterase family protein [Hymenobacter busanensis]
MKTTIPAHPLNSSTDLDPLLQSIGDARVVLLGEASHGTHEYYTWRTAITKRLVEEKGFQFVAVEGDWPDCFEVNLAVKQLPNGQPASQLLQTFNRWPTWMWGNWEIAALVDWLRQHNAALADKQKVGFYGLDVYSLWESLEQIMQYAGTKGEAAAQAAQRAYHCFEPYSADPQEYAEAVAFVSKDCEDEVLHMLRELKRRTPTAGPDGLSMELDFATEQNALVAVNAERYYKAMLRGGGSSWNVRDRHMMETLQRLLEFHGPDSKAIVWEHNTHIGDARYTDMAADGMVNVGQLARQQLGRNQVYAVGFGSYQGSVIAGKAWGAPLEKMPVPEARRNSWEALLHTELGRNALLFSSEIRHLPALQEHIGHRAIGVVYRPERERYGNYVPTVVPERYDAFLHFETTQALHPLPTTTDQHVPPDLYPWGE